MVQLMVFRLQPRARNRTREKKKKPFGRGSRGDHYLMTTRGERVLSIGKKKPRYSPYGRPDRGESTSRRRALRRRRPRRAYASVRGERSPSAAGVGGRGEKGGERNERTCRRRGRPRGQRGRSGSPRVHGSAAA
ncbi:hypothetical protein PUN28_004021 [Cardiocondyla obscurior]|uniref:Uncharacterized protein n=1 Tax=Cardiocondyla obscurior TaxID=286306 RepID=A0AAW2GPB7_9HYME